MSNLQQLNTNGCGVCQFISWDLVIRQEMNRPKGFKGLLAKIKDFFSKEKEEERIDPLCTKYNKLVPEKDICLSYKPKKQIKIFGALADEEVTFDSKLLERKWN